MWLASMAMVELVFLGQWKPLHSFSPSNDPLPDIQRKRFYSVGN